MGSTLDGLPVEIIILRSGAEAPSLGTEHSAGYDLRAMTDETVTIRPGEVALVPTGLAIHISNPGVAAMILPRSGNGHKRGLILGNTVGLIDADYQNEWFVSCWNRNPPGGPDVVIVPQERIAQVVFVPVIHPTFTVTSQFSQETGRGMGGFGSTGTK